MAILMSTIHHPFIASAAFEPGDGGWFTYELDRKTPKGWLLDGYYSAEYEDWGWHFPKIFLNVERDRESEVLAYIPLTEAEYTLHLFAAQADTTYRPWRARKTGRIFDWEWFPEK